MLEQHIKNWAEHELIHKGRRQSGVKKYLNTVKVFTEWLSQMDIKLEDVRRSHIDSFMKFLFYEKGNKNPSRANKLSALKSFFGYLVYSGLLSDNPAEQVPSPKFEVGIPQKFTTDELRYLFQGPDLMTEEGIRDLACLMTIYGAGLRASEICHLNMGDITDSGGYIRLTIVNSKGGKTRTLTLRKRPSNTLRAWAAMRTAKGVQKDDPVFVHMKRGTRLHGNSVNQILKKYARMVGMKESDAFVHKLRATFATDLYDAGREKCPQCGHPVEKIDILEIMVLMGHNDPKTTMRYIAISEKVLKKTAIPDRRWSEIY